MAVVKPKVDAVVVGMGWTGAIMALLLRYPESASPA
jgi:choline dehydrogenase-like flavoprotein